MPKKQDGARDSFRDVLPAQTKRISHHTRRPQADEYSRRGQFQR